MHVENWTCWDHEFFIKAALAGAKFVRVPEFLASFRMHAQSISTENRWQDKRERYHARIAQTIKTSGYAKGQYYKQLVRVARAVLHVTPSL
jgi:pyridoxine/pyridoxamine 5'-phosphate oxidase